MIHLCRVVLRTIVAQYGTRDAMPGNTDFIAEMTDAEVVECSLMTSGYREK